jgi:hypothetical protein
MIPTVVRIRKQAGVTVSGCDVYIGYPVRIGGWNLDYTKWSSPYGLSAYGKANPDRRDAIRLNAIYEEHIRSSPELMDSLHELAGKRLGCWCSPAPCHGDVLVKLFKEKFGIP